MIYKVYIKDSNGNYHGPKKFKYLIDAMAYARGEYIIIKNDNNTDEIIKCQTKDDIEQDDDLSR